MLNSKMYIAGNALQREVTRSVLDEFLGLVRWRAGGGDVALDVGCGDGSVTAEMLRPRLPAGVRLLGSDVSADMVRHVQHAYPDLQSFILDIGDPNGPPPSYAQTIDHVFSFFCLHWIQDQRQSMANIYDCLRPGGDMLITFVTKCITFEACEKLACTDKWRDLFGDVRRYVTPYQHVTDVEDTVTTLLQDIGFHVNLCQCIDVQYPFESLTARRQFIQGINPFSSRLSEPEFNLLIDDCVRESEEISKEHLFQLAVVCASKPEFE